MLCTEHMRRNMLTPWCALSRHPETSLQMPVALWTGTSSVAKSESTASKRYCMSTRACVIKSAA